MTWIAPQITRQSTTSVAGERQMLDSWLDFHRQTLLSKADMSVRWVYFHMIEEYARHNGHADLLRERIDGATGL
jgi:Protein of unknown function (DUF664)